MVAWLNIKKTLSFKSTLTFPIINLHLVSCIKLYKIRVGIMCRAKRACLVFLPFFPLFISDCWRETGKAGREKGGEMQQKKKSR